MRELSINKNLLIRIRMKTFLFRDVQLIPSWCDQKDSGMSNLTSNHYHDLVYLESTTICQTLKAKLQVVEYFVLLFS